MRKVVGATKRELIRQFLGESLIYSMISTLFALLLVILLLPVFSAVSGVELNSNPAEMPWLIPGFVGLALFVGFAAGSYPALFLSRFQPAQVIKGSVKAGAANSRFRSLLVVFQFVISITLIIGTGVVINQMSYMKNKGLGFNKENVICVDIMDNTIRRSLESIKSELKKIPGVLSVSASSMVPGEPPDLGTYVPEGFSDDQTQLIEMIKVDHDFISTLGIGMASFTAEQRTKEIGIRKVLGASVPGVTLLLSKDFVKLILFANIIAMPIAYFALNKWMQDFAYRAGIKAWIFLLTGALALVVSLLTVSYQSVKAALSNPVEAIKYE